MMRGKTVHNRSITGKFAANDNMLNIYLKNLSEALPRVVKLKK